MRLGALAALALVLLAVLPEPPREAEGGYWKSGDREGHYRVRVIPAASDARVRIEWIAHASAEAAEAAVASQTLSNLVPGDDPWQISTPELRAEGTATLLTLDARETITGERRLLAVELGEPGHYHLRR